METLYFQAPPEMAALSPVFVAAPTFRNGITLIQRLLNSTRKIIVYGENGYFMCTMPQAVANFFHACQNPSIPKDLHRFLHETTEFWTSNLMPDLRRALQLVLTHFYEQVRWYENASKSYGYNRWGVKHPLDKIGYLISLNKLLPHSKAIIIYRNLFDVAQSAKGRGWLKSSADFVQLARQWQVNLLPLFKQKLPAWLLLIRYEKLLDEPEKVIPLLEAHVGVEGIRLDVLDLKINTFAPPDTPIGKAYLPPESLTERERNILSEKAAEALSLTGYSP